MMHLKYLCKETKLGGGFRRCYVYIEEKKPVRSALKKK